MNFRNMREWEQRANKKAMRNRYEIGIDELWKIEDPELLKWDCVLEVVLGMAGPSCVYYLDAIEETHSLSHSVYSL